MIRPGSPQGHQVREGDAYATQDRATRRDAGLYPPHRAARCHAQPATKVYRIGSVRGQTASAGASESAAFTQRLRELGYTEGQNLVIEWRFADGQAERIPALVAELVRLQVDCLVVGGTEATRVAKQATRTIPIVMLNASEDPVRLGLITSLARPGGNITGVIDISEQLAGKRLALLKEAFHRAGRPPLGGEELPPVRG